VELLNYDKKSRLNNILSETKTVIVSLLRANDNFTRLLKYTTRDALAKPVNSNIRKEIYSQDSAKKRVFLSGYDGQRVSEVRSELHLSYSSVKPIQSSTTKIPYLRADIVVADDINVLDDGMSLRHDRLFQELCDTIEGQIVGTVGCVELAQPAQETVLQGNTHVVWSAIFKIGEIKL
jgi:hypothetical protein